MLRKQRKKIKYRVPTAAGIIIHKQKKGKGAYDRKKEKYNSKYIENSKMEE